MAELHDFDANATRPTHPRALAAFAEALHLSAADAAVAIEHARARLAACLGCAPEEVVWTRGGSHANALALEGAASLSAPARPRLVLSPLEHRASRQAALRLSARGQAQVSWLRAEAAGRVCLESAAAALASGPALLSVLLAHNETGVLQPIGPLEALAKEARVPLHVDAVQALARVPLQWSARAGITFMSLAAHKVGGVGGIGALLVRAGSPAHRRLLAGGRAPWAAGFAYAEGERGASAALCASFAAAAAELGEQERRAAWLAPLRDAFEQQLGERLARMGQPLACIGQGLPRLPNTTLLRLPGVEAEGLLMALDVAGFATSSGAACSAGAAVASPSLLAMGLSPRAGSEVLRVSLRLPGERADAVDAARRGLGQLAAAIETIVARARPSPS